MQPAVIRNALTIDVEDYYQVSAFAPYLARRHWSNLPSRVESNIERILELLADAGVHATFFTLACVARRHPGLARDIVRLGHELASHGYAHRRASDQHPLQFRRDVGCSKRMLEDIAGVEVLGYRAPSFSIGADNLWAFDVLAQAGYRYSSSVYPIVHDHYGMPEAPRFAYRPRGSEGVLELPVSTVRLLNRNFPAGGGGYFRLYPYALSRWCLRWINVRERQPGIFYFHPWEIDPDQPRLAGLPMKTRFRHYLNLDRTAGRLAALVEDFAWDRIDRIFPVRP